jgi:hypothetical protein
MNVLFVLAVAGFLDGPAIRLNGVIDGKSNAAIEVHGIDPASVAALAKAKFDREQWVALFAVRVTGGKNDEKTPALLGSYQIEQGVVRFEPRFPLAVGVRYRAVFDPARLAGGAGKSISAEFHQPKPAAKATAVVEHVYPTRNKLPENQLKFYIHFCAPMTKGGSYRHVQLLGANGNPVESPFLELDEELWDPDCKRFTLYLDPGRIKRGLKPREEVGPVLEEGKSYTLVVDKQWTDADGNPLRETFRKKFTVGPPDEEAIEPKTWKFQTPRGDKKTERSPLSVTFPKPLDNALLHRLLWVIDESGRKVPGTVTVDEEETRWNFHPDGGVWRMGGYHLVIDKALEDLAGNNIGRPFEVDVFRPVQRELKAETVKLPFRVLEPGKPERP